jgi:hypothetical protein
LTCHPLAVSVDRCFDFPQRVIAFQGKVLVRPIPAVLPVFEDAPVLVDIGFHPTSPFLVNLPLAIFFGSSTEFMGKN